MNRRPTRADVAQQAGVSKTTVTYVLGDRDDIAIPETTRERVRHVARQLGYHPHAAAQALRSGRSNTVTVGFPIHIGAYNAHLLQAIERQTNASGYRMVATTIGRLGLQSVEADVNAILNSLTDGVILIDMPAAFQPYLGKIFACGKPVVSAGVFTVPDTDTVEVSLEQGAAEALTHLLASHPRNLAFFGPREHDENAIVDTFAARGQLDPRLSAYTEAMRAAGRPVLVIPGNPGSRSASMEAIRAHVASHGCPDALFCFNDEMAIGANRALHDLGFRTPEDVLIVGCDGVEDGEYITPALSTIVQPVDRMCAMAWNLVAQRLAEPDAPRRHVHVSAQFVQRESSHRTPKAAALARP